jgi:hypothetical protein
MIDFSNLPQKNFSQVIYSSTSWIKPRGITMVYILTIGGGAGGGGGFTAPTGSNKSGGGGGGSGATSRVFLPAILCPDMLQITIGAGGLGGAAGSAGSDGGTTIVEAFRRIGTSATYVLIANGGGGGGAGVGTASSRGAAGSSGALATTSSANFSNEGITTFSMGNAGVQSGLSNGSVGLPIGLQAQSLPLSGGGGGGGAGTSSNNGGNLSGFGDIPNILGGSVTINDGGDGFFRLKPFYSTGGAGGYGNNTGAGGRGGNAAIGCGGGGGGAGTTGGRGGNGGDGLVIITCW